MATFETEIRKLQPVELCTLAQYLDESSYWKKLMAIVPKENEENTFLFNHDHFRMIEQAIHQQKRSGAEIFLSEWSTLNRKRPNCKLLLDLLVKIQFFKAADYLAVDVLKIGPPERPKQGPGAPVDISDKMLEKQLMEFAGLDFGSETDMSYSMHYVEKPAELVPVQAEKEAPQISYPDMIGFSVTMSDMMKFSDPVADDLKELPEQVSSKMTVDADDAEVCHPNELPEQVSSKMTVDADDAEVSHVNELPEQASSKMKGDADDAEFAFSDYGLQVVDSANIPKCVNASEVFSDDQNTGNLSTATQSTISASSIDDSNSTLPTASESDIPIAVLKYSKNDT